MRYLGLLRSHVTKDSLPSAMLLVSMLASCWKNFIRSALREATPDTRPHVILRYVQNSIIN